MPLHFQGLLQTLQLSEQEAAPVAQGKGAHLDRDGWEDAEQEPFARWEERDELRH